MIEKTLQLEQVLPRSLEGLVAVVTGGNRGIGLGIASVLGRAGATVCLWARDKEVTKKAIQSLSDFGITCSGYYCDVTDEATVIKAAEDVVKNHGSLNIMIANAGAGARTPFLETSLEQWDQVVRLNLTGTFLCFREASRQMVAQGNGGALVAVSSIASIHAAPTMHHYAAAKAGLGGLVRSVAVELAQHQIRVNSDLPGWTDNHWRQSAPDLDTLLEETTISIPAGRWGTPEDIGMAVLYLADPKLSYHTGADLVVDGGYSKMPPYLAVRFAAGRSGY
jgi:hypothetical protein